jgi:small ligand-binding sensory domain FIST
MGVVPSEQGIAIGTTQVQPGDLFCFQVRDGTTAQQDLKLMVQRAKTERLFDIDKIQPVAAIQISCVARGRGMFDGVPNVDLSNVQELVGIGEAPVVAGFFANGEIGPVGLAGFSTTVKDKGGQQAYLHSFTTVAATFCEYTTQSASPSVENGNGEVGDSSFGDAWG